MSNQAEISIAVVDDHPLTRTAVAMQLSLLGFAQVYEFDNMRELDRYANHSKIDWCVMDLSVPEFRLMIDFPLIKKKFPKIGFVAFTGSTDPDMARRCRQLGFRGFLHKAETPDEIRRKLSRLLAGENWEFPDQDKADGIPVELTTAQAQVLELVAMGRRNAEIARLLGISESTVEFHKKNLKTRLGARNSAELVNLARQRGFIGD